MNKKELEERVAYLEGLLVRASAWVGVKPAGELKRDYRKVMREIYAIKHEVESRNED